MINLTWFLLNTLVNVSICESAPIEAQSRSPFLFFEFEWKPNLTFIRAPLSYERPVFQTLQSSFQDETSCDEICSSRFSTTKWSFVWWDCRAGGDFILYLYIYIHIQEQECHICKLIQEIAKQKKAAVESLYEGFETRSLLHNTVYPSAITFIFHLRKTQKKKQVFFYQTFILSIIDVAIGLKYWGSMREQEVSKLKEFLSFPLMLVLF